MAAVEGTEDYGLPRKLENYVSYLELTWIVLNVEEREKIRWHTFVLKDFDVRTVCLQMMH